MAYRLTWHTEKQIVLLTLHRDCSLEDIQALSRELTAKYLNGSSRPVHVVVDMSRLERFPVQLVQIRAAVHDIFRHPMLGKMVIVGWATPLAGCIVDTVARSFQVECLWAANLEQVRQIISRPARLIPCGHVMRYRYGTTQLR
jgi:hypothetical protein